MASVSNRDRLRHHLHQQDTKLNKAPRERGREPEAIDFRANLLEFGARGTMHTMTQPWLQIPLADYEAHMALPDIGQAQMLADLLQQATSVCCDGVFLPPRPGRMPGAGESGG